MNQHYPFTLQPLPYEYDALEPYINEETMHFHHDKHLQTYVDNLNNLLKDYPQYHDCTLHQLVAKYCHLPEAIQTGVRNNAGGVYNHQLYFYCMGKGETRPTGKLAECIDRCFGSYDNWREKMKASALSQFGSGWAWLVTDPKGNFKIMHTLNQDNPLAKGMTPLLLVDVWEHAYYLQYQNRRAEYLDNWFQVINWRAVEQWADRVCGLS